MAQLCDAFVREFNPLLGRSILGLDAGAMALLERYDWPGNVRELRNTIERMMVLAKGDRLTAEDVPENIRENRAPAPAPEAAEAVDSPSIAAPAAPAEAELIRRALAECKGNRTAAAKALGIPLRTLYRRIKAYGLE